MSMSAFKYDPMKLPKDFETPQAMFPTVVQDTKRHYADVLETRGLQYFGIAGRGLSPV